MGPEAAVNIVFRDELAKAADPAAARARYLAEYREKFANPYAAAALGYVDEVIRPRETRARLCRALAALGNKRDTNPPKKHGNIPLVKARVAARSRPFAGITLARRRRGSRRGVASAGCATAPQPVTKIVNGRVVVTRAVSPEAYEHVARALLYEEEERWKEAADELQRALPFDPDAAEVRAQLAELFIRLGRLDDAAEQIARSLQIAPTVEGYLAKAHLADAYDDERAPRAGDPGAARGGARWRSTTTIPRRSSATHLELAEAQVSRSISTAALETARRLVDAVPDTLRGRVQLAALAWATGALDRGGGGAGGRDRDRAERRRGAHPARRAAGGDRTRSPPAKASFRDAIDRAEAPMAVARRVRGLAGPARRGGRGAGAGRSAGRRRGRRGHAGRGERVRAHGQAARPRAWRSPSGRRSWACRPGGARCCWRARRSAKEDKPARGRRLPERRKREPDASSRRGCAPPSCCASRASSTRPSARSPRPRRGRAGRYARAGRGSDDRAGVALQPDRREARRRGAGRPPAGRGARQGRRRARRSAADPGARRGRRSPRRLAAGDRARRAAAGAQAAQRRGAELRRLRRRRSRPRSAARAPAPAGGGRAVARLGRDHRQPGWAYFRAGDLARADVYLEQAGRLEPGDAEMLEHLGDLYAKRQERDRALAAYRQALGLQAQRPRRARAGRPHPDPGSQERRRPMRAIRFSRLASAKRRLVGERGLRPRCWRLALTACCAHAQPTVRPYPAPTADALLAALTARQAAVRGMNARVRATSWLGGERVRATVNMLVAARRPPALRGRGQPARHGGDAGHRRHDVRVLRRAQERGVARARLPGQRRVADPHPPRARRRRRAAARRRAPARRRRAASTVSWDAGSGADVLVLRAPDGGMLLLLRSAAAATRDRVLVGVVRLARAAARVARRPTRTARPSAAFASRARSASPSATRASTTASRSSSRTAPSTAAAGSRRLHPRPARRAPPSSTSAAVPLRFPTDRFLSVVPVCRRAPLAFGLRGPRAVCPLRAQTGPRDGTRICSACVVVAAELRAEGAHSPRPSQPAASLRLVHVRCASCSSVLDAMNLDSLQAERSAVVEARGWVCSLPRAVPQRPGRMSSKSGPEREDLFEHGREHTRPRPRQRKRAEPDGEGSGKISAR